MTKLYLHLMKTATLISAIKNRTIIHLLLLGDVVLRIDVTILEFFMYVNSLFIAKRSAPVLIITPHQYRNHIYAPVYCMIYTWTRSQEELRHNHKLTVK